MKIKCLFLTALLLASLSLTTFSQTPLIQTDDERAGSADTLNGKVYVVSIFISTPDNPWKKQDKLSTFEKHKEAQN